MTRRPFGSIRQLPSGRFQAHYTDPHTGARIKAPKTFHGRNAAERWLSDRRRDVEAGLRRRSPARLTFGQYAEQWLTDRMVAGRPLKDRTREHYRALLDDYLLPTFGNRPIAAITKAEVRAWHAQTLTDAPTMRAHAYSLLRTIFASAIDDEDDLLDVNPCRIKGAGSSKRVHKIRPASVPELTALVAAMPERMRLMLVLASWCALRFGEIVELRRGDIDIDGEIIRIERAAVRTKTLGYHSTTPKSDAGVRDVAIPPHLVAAIEDHLSRFVDPQPDALLFPAGHGGHMATSTVQRHYYRARTMIGRPDLRFHDLRHSGAVLAAATGASLAELMARLGHSTPTAAMRYQHAAQGRDREIAALLSKFAE